MGSIVYLTNKKNGKVYAYINEKTLDKATGKYVYRRRCIGHVDPETGTIEENRPKNRVEDPTAVSVGVDMYLSKIAKDCGLIQSLRIAFPQDWRLILTCAMYIITEDSPLSVIGPWSETNVTPFGGTVEVEDLEALLSSIDTEGEEAFMRIWRKKVGEDDLIVLFSHYAGRTDQDSSGSIVSSPGMKYVPSEVVMCYGRGSSMPISYVRNPVPSIRVPAMRAAIDRMYWLGVRPMIAVDRAYTTEHVIRGFREEGDYIAILQNSDPVAKKAIESNRDTIVDSANYYTLPDGSHGFVSTDKGRGRPFNTLVFYSEENAERDMGTFFSMIDVCRQELEQGAMSLDRMPLYAKFFSYQGGMESARAELNSDRVMEYASTAGYMVAVSDCVDDYDEIMEWRIKMAQCARVFSTMGGAVDSPRLKLFTEHNSESRMFVQFIAYILHSAVTNSLVGGSLMREFTVKSAIKEMGGLMRISGFGLKNPRLTKTNYRQDILLKSVGLEPV